MNDDQKRREMQWNSKQAHPSRFGLDERRCETSLAERSVAAPLEAGNYTHVAIIRRTLPESESMLRKSETRRAVPSASCPLRGEPSEAKVFGVGLLSLMLFAGTVFADTGLDAVKALGHLNGEALACKQMALVDRVRTRIVNEAPKTREVGETFEAATTERFLAMGSDQASCTDARNLAERIEQATQALRAAFAPAPGRKE